MSLLLRLSAGASGDLSTDDPETFFNTLATRLLKSELNLDLHRLQVWPTNQLTPAAHRLLQVTANLYDATTNRFTSEPPHPPTVFRPQFTNDNGDIFICGYTENGDTDCLTNRWLDLRLAGDRAPLQATDCVHGIPFIIGAKKGFPNFNEFSMQSVFQIARKLEITRSSLNAALSDYQTNQMFVMGITNYIGVEAWNSYCSNYSRAVDILVLDELKMALTNDFGLVLTQYHVFSNCLSLAADAWPGYGYEMQPDSFKTFLWTNLDLVPSSAYRHRTQDFSTESEPVFDTGLGFPQPQWGLAITNRLRFFMVDRETHRLVDMVTLEGLNDLRDLSAEMASSTNDTPGFGSIWDTNRIGDPTDVFAPTRGILSQIGVSLGYYPSAADWSAYGSWRPMQSSGWCIDDFRAFFQLSPIYGNSILNTNLSQPVPFTPGLRFSHYLSAQTCDPAVHQTLADLQYAGELRRESIKPVAVSVLANVGQINKRYQPWGGNPFNFPKNTGAFNPALKDPLVRQSDDWNFPDAEPLDLAMLGRVHRGTPWQTIYLKSADVAMDTWCAWTGNPNAQEAARTRPINDWRLASLLASLLNTNRPHDLASANQPIAAHWLPVLDGLSALTNNLTDAQVRILRLTMPPTRPSFEKQVMAGDSPQAALIADVISATKATQPGGAFRDPGDVLATPELSLASPWLNLSSSTQLQGGVTDEAYEQLPSQLLARLRPDPIGEVVRNNGGFRVQFTGFDGESYAIEASTNLLDWLPLSTNTPTNGVFDFGPPIEPTNAPHFYRSVLLPRGG